MTKRRFDEKLGEGVYRKKNVFLSKTGKTLGHRRWDRDVGSKLLAYNAAAIVIKVYDVISA